MTAFDRYSTVLSFRDDGHASDLALSALADGEDRLLPERVLLHVDGCELCTERMAALAFASLDLERQLRRAPVSHPFPVVAVGIGILLSISPAAGLLLRSPWSSSRLGDLWVGLRLTLRGLRSGWPIALQGVGGSQLLLSFLASALLLLGGLVIARAASSTAFLGTRA